MMHRSRFLFLILSGAFAIAVQGRHSCALAEQDSPRRWKIEYQRNGEWSDFGTFATRQEAQAKLESVRAAKRSKGNSVVRIVPTDWSRYEKLGALSAKYESGGRASGSVSSGKGDAGGVSYGTYQLSSKVGTAQKFADQYYAEWFHGTQPGTQEFSARWKQLATEREPELAAFEHLFIADTHYQPFADRLRDDLGLDLNHRSNALRDVAWSTAVQHGAGNKIFARALDKQAQEHKLNDLSDQQIIELVYAERGRVDANGVAAYFTKSSPQVQKAVLNRFKNEAQDALKELAAEKNAKRRN